MLMQFYFIENFEESKNLQTTCKYDFARINVKRKHLLHTFSFFSNAPHQTTIYCTCKKNSMTAIRCIRYRMHRRATVFTSISYKNL